MTVLSNDRKSERRQGLLFSLPVAAGARIFAGAMVSANGAGYLVPASDTEGHALVGVARKEADNTAGPDGAVRCEGYLAGLFGMNASGISQTDLVRDVYVADDNTVSGGIVAQPLNVTGVKLERTPLSTGGTRQLSYVAATGLLSYGGGAGVDVSAGGVFTIAAQDGCAIRAVVDQASLPAADAADAVQLRHVKAGRMIEMASATSIFVEISGAERN